MGSGALEEAVMFRTDCFTYRRLDRTAWLGRQGPRRPAREIDIAARRHGSTGISTGEVDSTRGCRP